MRILFTNMPFYLYYFHAHYFKLKIGFIARSHQRGIIRDTEDDICM